MMRSVRQIATLSCSKNAAVVPATVGVFRQLEVLNLPQNRWFSSAQTVAAPKLASTLQSEFQYEKSNYEPAANIATFLEKSGWKLTEKDGDINMSLTKTVGELTASVEFQLVSPTYTGDGDEEEGAPTEPQETTDFSVTVHKANGNGAIFYCTTVGNDEKYRFIVGNVRYFADAEEKNSMSAYNGPEFEDLDDNLQAGVDEWLSSIGINEDLCDFVDAMAVDKEQREYMRWLNRIADIVQ